MRTTLSAFVLHIGSVICHKAQPHVESPAGTFIGNSSIADLEQFLGIPYAQPPVDDLRFANPVPAGTPLSGTIDASAYGPGCSQLDDYAQYNGLSEDCLTLNIVRPSGIKSHADLPVMFWIHGGGNANGQSIFYNGTALVQHSMVSEQPVVYVSINYRLGGFGFLNSPMVKSAGFSNLGRKDQYLALQWVHANIRSFGGDPGKVTIFGESAGAADCWAQLHYAYKKHEDAKYFRGMITQSGAPGSPAYPLALPSIDGEQEFAQLLADTGCKGQGIACLREVPHRINIQLRHRQRLVRCQFDASCRVWPIRIVAHHPWFELE